MRLIPTSLLLPISFGIQLLAAETSVEPEYVEESVTALDAKLVVSLEELDRAFDTSFAWWANVYDSKSGGSFYCLSGKQASEEGETEFGPDIEATSKLVDVLGWTGILDDCPQGFKDAVINYMQIRQDPRSGFFRDPHFADSYSARTLDRAVEMATRAIRDCGGRVPFATPLERRETSSEAEQHFEHLENETSLTSWLDGLPWNDRIWTCGSSLRAQSGVFKQLDEPLRSELLDLIEAFLELKQHRDGYYGSPDDDHWFSRLSGTYKIISFLEANGRRIPNVGALRASVLEDLERRKYNNVIVLYNTTNMLDILQRNGAPFTKEQRLMIVRRGTAILSEFHGADGGFLTHLSRTAESANGKLLGKPILESNTNATGLAHRTRNLLYELATGRDEARGHAKSGDILRALRELYK